MRKRKPKGTSTTPRPERRSPHRTPERLWLYGDHAVLAALANPRRTAVQLLTTAEAMKRHEAGIRVAIARNHPRLAVHQDLEREDFRLSQGETAVHQGIALQVAPLDQPPLEELIPDQAKARSLVVVLDQVTDPQNVGAILRSACAFGALAVVATDRNAAAESGALAKAASGALEHIAYVQVTNLARSLDWLKTRGFWCLGLSAAAERPIAEETGDRPIALVMGAEGSGLRRLTREHCDDFYRLPTRGPIDQLNVSNAAAVALYELAGRRQA